MTLWSLSGDRAPHGVAVAKMRIQPCPPAPLATLVVRL